MTGRREKNLVKNTAILSIGTFVPKIFSFVVTPLLTGNLSKTEYGQYDLISTVVSLLLPAVTLQISSAAFRFLIDVKKNKEESSRIITNIYVFVAAMATLTSVIFYVIYGHRLGINGLIVCGYFLIDIFFQSTQQIIRGLGKNLSYSIGSIINSAVNMMLMIVLVGGLLVPNMGLSGVLISLLVAQAMATLFLVGSGKLHSFLNGKYISIREIKRLLEYSWPMVPNNLSGWALNLSDRLVITAVLGIEANASYAVANKLPTLISALQSTFIFAWQENASIASKDSDRAEYYAKMFNDVFKLIVCFAAILIAFTPILWMIFIRGDYSESYIQMPVLYLGMVYACMSSIVGGIYIAFKKTVNVGITTFLAAVINLVIDLVAVGKIGIWAGSISTLVSYLFLLVFRMWDVQKIQKIQFSYLPFLFGQIVLFVMSAINMIQVFWLDIINIIICIVVVIALERTMLMAIIKRFLFKRH